MQAPKSNDDRSSEAKAYHWAARIMTVCLEMVVPGLMGYGVDQFLGTKVLFVLLGFGAGLTFGMWHLLKMTSRDNDSYSKNKS